MGSKTKLLLIVSLLLLGLGVATIINISLNFRDYTLKSATSKASTVAAIVKDGLTAHMVNGIMDKRKYFLEQISSNNSEIKSLWIVRSPAVVKQFGPGFHNETARDVLDKDVLKSGKMIQKIQETSNNIILRVSIPYKATSTGNPNCLSCHQVTNGDTLGVISMEFDITNMRNSGLITILKILGINLLFILLALFLINYYITPYIKLFDNMQEGIKKAYGGDFTHKFITTVDGKAKEIVEHLNTLFQKMQETFGDIKYNLATFIPQECITTHDPLHEAKTIIEELSDIYKFKKTIELDKSKEIVYNRIIDVLREKYSLQHFAFYEINIHANSRKVIYISENTVICKPALNNDALSCRAYRTKTDVISTEFINLCQECIASNIEYICIPFNINDDFAILLSIAAKDSKEIAKYNSYVPNIKNYLEAAKPVIESRILTDKLRDTSLRDGMTNLYNRRFLETFIDTFMKQAKRADESYSVLMLDIDFFKDVNDTYGHDIGDKVIIALGKILKESIRESDFAIRYGGEEFVVLLHNANDEGTLKVAQKIHTNFSNVTIPLGANQTLQKTISIGIAKFPTDGNTIWKCIKYADIALYVAKTTGRNKIVIYDESMNENGDF